MKKKNVRKNYIFYTFLENLYCHIGSLYSNDELKNNCDNSQEAQTVLMKFIKKKLKNRICLLTFLQISVGFSSRGDLRTEVICNCLKTWYLRHNPQFFVVKKSMTDKNEKKHSEKLYF